jgi:beta-lactam-binding protein with PASTA domain/tRNA A-37 threonylcarbamoyl transferase component Bud32
VIGTLIASRYLIVARVGGGGMADVYRAEDKKLSRPVAVKVLRHEFLKDEEFVRRFENEARAAASLSHPNVVSVYDVGEMPDGNRFIVMEYVDGETLKDVLQERGPLSARQALTVVAAVASALAAAHRKGIVHRDIKPENILLTEDGEIKVTDFGIARAASGRTIVHTGAIMGSAHYFSPEQARGGYVDEKSDLYSLGAVLFELLVGRPPYEADSPLAVALKHVQEPVPSVRRVRPGVSRRVEAIVQKLLAKDPADRFRSAEAALRQIQEVLADEGGPEALHPGRKAPTLVVEKGRRARRGRRSPGAVAVGVAVLLVLIAFGVYRAAADWLDAPVLRVPGVVGRTLPTARRILAAHHLGAVVLARRPSDLKAGLVLSETPGPGSAVKEGRVIALVLSSGPQRVRLPAVGGEPQSAAAATLNGLGLRVRTVPQASTQPAGTVLGLSPAAGRLVPQGSTVTLYVSKGANVTINMPSVVGLPLDTAASDLENLGLYVASTSYAPSSAPYGTVLEQSVAAGAKTAPGPASTSPSPKGPRLVAAAGHRTARTSSSS